MPAEVQPSSARFFRWSGQPEKYLDVFERLIEERDSNVPYIVTSPAACVSLRDEPRFREGLRRMNFPEDVIERILDENR